MDYGGKEMIMSFTTFHHRVHQWAESNTRISSPLQHIEKLFNQIQVMSYIALKAIKGPEDVELRKMILEDAHKSKLSFHPGVTDVSGFEEDVLVSENEEGSGRVCFILSGLS